MASIEFEIMGWFGAALIIWAHFLLTEGKMKAESKDYQAMNLIGPIFIGINSLLNGAYPSLVTSLFWVIIGIYGIERVFKARKK